MPEQPLPKRRPPSPGLGPKPSSAARYAELHCLSNFSFLEGASHPDELVERAAALNYAALAITDRNSLAGVVRAHVAAKAAALKLIVGAEITPLDAPPVILLATDRTAYGRLARLITVGRRRAPKGDCQLTLDDVAQHSAGLIACVVMRRLVKPPPSSALDTNATTTERTANDPRMLQLYRDTFADRCYAAVELHLGAHDQLQLAKMKELAVDAQMPVVATNDVHYHIARRQSLQDVLTAIRHGCQISQLGARMFPNGERYLKSPDQMANLFRGCPEAVARTLEISERCTFSLDELRYEYPEELGPPGVSPLDYLRQLTWQGAHWRYPGGVPSKVQRLIEHELKLIAELRYEAYFLTVWDLVQFARGRQILCQGRGSAANSVVCYCLGVTSVDPEQIDVLFERFVSKQRDEAPDIDVDFEHERREEVIQYIYQKYGRERAGIAATVITYRPRSAVRDVGKALGLSLDRVDTIAKALSRYNDADELKLRLREAGLEPESTVGRQFLSALGEILEFPRHLSQHVGGMVITRGPLCELTPIENAAMPGRTVVQWDKDDLEALGILKVDCLALGMLTAVRKSFALIEQHHGRQLSLATVPAEDPEVYKMVQRADTIGVFQIESRAQMSMLPRLRPRCFYDLVIEVSIVRPGPIQGNMVHPYLRRRAGKEKVEYPSEEIEAVLKKTLGVPIFQEQAMRLAVVAAGFTPGEADQLRRAMGAWRRPGLIDDFRQKLIHGMRSKGHPEEFAERLFNQIRGFGEYGFPESHAASFALLVYVSSWLKRYYPAAFTAALLNSQPMGFYAPAQLVSDVRRHEVEVLPVDANHSQWDCTLESNSNDPTGSSEPSTINPAVTIQRAKSLRLGLRMVSGLSRRHADAIVVGREHGKFDSLDDFSRRTELPSSVLKRLAQAGAFQSFEAQRRDAVWQALAQQPVGPLLQDLPNDEPSVILPDMTLAEEVIQDYRSVHLSLRGHPLQFIRPALDQLKVVTARTLSDLTAGSCYRVAGLVLMRQRPSTAKGITFVTLEDETGTVNLIVRQHVWDLYHRAAQGATLLMAYGELQREKEVIHILTQQLEDLSHHLVDVDSRSRDFR